MAKTKQLSVEQLDEAVKDLDFKEQIRHFQNMKILLDDIDQKSAEEIELAEQRRKAIQSVNTGGK